MKEKGACKHVVAALLMLLKHQERTEGNLPKNAEEKRAYQVLEEREDDYSDEQLEIVNERYEIAAQSIPGVDMPFNYDE